MVEPKTIEQLLHFMKGHIHLSRYDEKFIDNISMLKQVTTNQVVLFHTLLFKYQRQFAKHELHVDKLVDMPWSVNVVESSIQYTEGHLNITDDIIYFKCPFNRSFIDSFRKIPLNSFIWDKVERQYKSPYSTYSLRLLLTAADKFFPTIHKCQVAEYIIDELKQYELTKYWQPTLVNRNGNLFIVATNSSLEESLGDLQLNTDVSTLARLASCGVNIETGVVDDTPVNKFACEPVTELESGDLTTMISWLKELQCDLVYISGSTVANSVRKKLMKDLKTAGIKHCDTNTEVAKPTEYNFPVLVKFRKKFESSYDPTKVSKIIHLVNSEPINIK